MPLSASVLVDRAGPARAPRRRALDRLPDELRRARWLLRERDEFLASRQREADMLLDDVRAQAERMVQRTEIVRQANQVAQRILDDAREEARRLRHEAEDYCDQRLASFEIVLERTLKTVQAGREKLQAVPPPLPRTASRLRRRGRRRVADIAPERGSSTRTTAEAMTAGPPLRRATWPSSGGPSGTRWHEVRQGPIDGLDCSGSAVPDGPTPVADVVLEAVLGGVSVTGTVSAPVGRGVPALPDAGVGGARMPVRELYTEDGDGEETYPLVDDEVDLEPLVRDAVLLELPQAPLCRPDCQGLCPFCGVNRNEETCGCEAPPDPRWGALDVLRVPAGPSRERVVELDPRLGLRPPSGRATPGNLNRS